MNQRTSWSDFIGQCEPGLRAFIRHWMKGRSLVGYGERDVCSHVWQRLIEHYPRVPETDREGARRLAYRIARNKLIELHQSASNQLELLADTCSIDREFAEGCTQPRDGGDQPNRSAHRSEANEIMKRSMATLSPFDRTLIKLRVVDTLRFREIGRRLSMTEDQARKQFRSAADRLRRLLLQAGLTPSQITL